MKAKKKRKLVWCPGGDKQTDSFPGFHASAKDRKKVRCPICNRRLLPRVIDCEAWNAKYGSHNFDNPGACIHLIYPAHKTLV